MSGYCSIGKFRSPMMPTMMSNTEMQIDKMGRSINNLVVIICSFYSYFCFDFPSPPSVNSPAPSDMMTSPVFSPFSTINSLPSLIVCSDLYNKVVLEKAELNKQLKDIENSSILGKIKNLLPKKKTLICDYFKK